MLHLGTTASEDDERQDPGPLLNTDDLSTWTNATPLSQTSTERQDHTKAGFFDLPVELRLPIYELYCDSVGRTAVVSDGGPLHKPYYEFRSSVPWNCAAYVLPRHISRQFQEEFLQIWASVTTFELFIPRSSTGRLLHFQLRDLDVFWFQARDFLHRVGALARRHVRSFRIIHETEVNHCRACLSNCLCLRLMEQLRHDTRSVLQAKFERLSDVHPDLKIEVELVRVQSRSPSWAMKHVYTLRQTPVEAIRETRCSEWQCSVGPAFTWGVDYSICKDSPSKICPEHLETRAHYGTRCGKWSWQLNRDKNE